MNRRTLMQQATQWITLDATILLRNFRMLKKMLPRGMHILPVVKSNAYGHGAVLIARLLAKENIWGFGVANYTEALVLRSAGIRQKILVLSYCIPEAIRQTKGISFPAHDLQHIKRLQRAGRRLHTSLALHLKIDTGTSRIGFLPNEIPAALRVLQQSPSLRLEGVFSHYADAENSDQTFTQHQMRVFHNLDKQFFSSAHLQKKSLLHHIACTAAVLTRSTGAGKTAQWLARVGIGLYEFWPSADLRRLVAHRQRPSQRTSVLTWKTRLLQVKTVPRGTTIGYGRTYTTRTKMRIGILPVGYADGYDRRFSNRAYVLVAGRRCRVLGRVSMNITIIDLTNASAARNNDEVVLIGKQGSEEVTTTELARIAGTIHYEIISRLHPSIPRIVIHER